MGFSNTLTIGIPTPESTEQILVKPFPLSIVENMVTKGKITDGMSSLALFLCLPRLRAISDWE
jgi:hypothetical protein